MALNLQLAISTFTRKVLTSNSNICYNITINSYIIRLRGDIITIQRIDICNNLLYNKHKQEPRKQDKNVNDVFKHYLDIEIERIKNEQKYI